MITSFHPPPRLQTPAMVPFRLDGLGVVRVSGDDRTDFLQGQLTQDLNEVLPQQTRLWGWNNPKGRLLAVGQALATGDATLLVMPRELLDSTVQRLQMFVLRAKVQIEATSFQVAGLASGPESFTVDGLELGSAADASATDGQACVARIIGDPARALRITPPDVPPADADARGEAAWQLADVRAGLPAISAATAEAFVPQMVNLDLLGGISFTKGCYVGQEVVARTQNLGRIKRRMFRFATPVPADPGNDVVDADGARAGKVVRCAAAEEGHELLAVVQLASVGGPLFVGDAVLSPLTLPYRVPENA